ncbi:LysE family translocator [Amycolatopsis sp. CA-230715]|uniref:LysE family translocator n=1 Tax=Amycolatopsis sp. CA-230715 TaxID=2745196 RepID=UPI001C00FA40|nr:LysE family translocator [Amycolatopsis sp. CA-230715]
MTVVVTLAFVMTCLVIVIAPGPTFAVLLNQSLRHGRRAGLATVLGNTTGLVFWAAASALGLTALIRTSEVAFVVLKVAGAVYLCWLGVRSLIRSRSRAASEEEPEPVAGGVASAFRAGLITNLANPKAAVLYLALIPQFLPADGDPAFATAVLACVQMGISVAWYTLLLLALGFSRRVLARPAVKARVDQLSGLVLVGLGVRMVTMSRAAL